MSNIVKATIKITGYRPLIQHQFTPESIPLEKQEKDGVAGNSPNEWKKSCMLTPNRQMYVRGDYIFSLLKAAAKYTKKGKGSLESAIGSALFILDDIVLIENRFAPIDVPVNDKTADVYVDISGVVNPSTKARNVRYRLAAKAGWTCTFNIQWDKTIISRGQMEAILNDAGTLVGLSDGRKIGNGRFTVESFSYQDSEEVMKA